MLVPIDTKRGVHPLVLLINEFMLFVLTTNAARDMTI